jgi:Zn-finger nucleic acid-binding protein
VTLRVLVACGACGRQFAAGERPPGDRFHCPCGERVAVPEPRPREAADAHCPACGGPRAAGKATCSFCAADFALAGRDRDTLCPACRALMPRSARFCPACAVPITASEDAGTRTGFACPACRPVAAVLTSRRLAEGSHLAALECGRCTGVWLDRDTFALLAEEARRGFLHKVLPRGPLPPGGGTAGCSSEEPRPCPVCAAAMTRRTYGRNGILVDSCRLHGVWFDGEELALVLAWMRRGGAERAARLAAEDARQEGQREPPPAERRPMTPADWFTLLVIVAVRLVPYLFRR